MFLDLTVPSDTMTSGIERTDRIILLVEMPHDREESVGPRGNVSWEADMFPVTGVGHWKH